MSEFNPSKEDVITLAKAVVNDHPVYQAYHNCRYEGYICHFCGTELNDIKSRELREHEIDCPVLVAQDILTGIEDKAGK